MANYTDKAMKALWGTSDARRLGVDRTLRGLRQGDRRELGFGLALSALAYLQRTKPRKQLIHREMVPQGAAVVIHNRESGEPRLEILDAKKIEKLEKKARKAKKKAS